MSVCTLSSATFKVTPPLPSGARIDLITSPGPLVATGANIFVSVSTAALCADGSSRNVLSAQTIGHIDSGATFTNIDISLAQRLGLVPSGYAKMQTASGTQTMPTFVIDLSFPSLGLRPIRNLQIGSCLLGYKVDAAPSAKNFGILIGRDIMSRWHITWDGLTSTVTICD